MGPKAAQTKSRLINKARPRHSADGFFGDRGALRPVNVDELAPDMGHAGDFSDGAGAIEVLEPGIAIGMHPAAVAGEMVLGVLAFAVAGEPIPGSGRGIADPRAFVAGVCPEPRGLGLAGAGRQHADRCVVGKNRLSRQDMSSDGIGQGLQQGSGFANPVRQGGAIQIKAFTVEDLALTIQRKMVGILADQHMGQQTRSRTATFDGPRRQR